MPTEESPRSQDYIEALTKLFERIGLWSFDHRWVVLAGGVAALAVSLHFASGLRFDNSMESFFDTRDPSYAAYLQYRDDFGSDEVAYIVYEVPGAPHGPFDLEAMRKIARLTEALEEEVPFAKEVTSLANVEYLEGVPDGIEVYELLEDFPETQEELLAIREKVMAKELYLDSLVSRDGLQAAITIEMDRSSVDPVADVRLDPEGGDGLDNLYPQVSYHAIEKLIRDPAYADIRFHHVGDVPLNSIYNEISAAETGLLAGITFLIIGVMLALFFRRPVGVVGPLVLVALSVVAVLGLVGLLGWNIDMMFMMVPNLLIAVGVANAVHFVSEFLVFHAETGDRREAVTKTLSLVGVPCLLTALTTAAGFASLSIAPIKAISHFAVLCSLGVLAAFGLSVTLLFVFLTFGRRTTGRSATEAEILRARGGRLFDAGLRGVAEFVIRRRITIIAVWCVVFAVSAVGITRLRVDSNFLQDFSADEPIRIATNHVDQTMGGTTNFIYLFDSGEADGIKNPQVLRDLERLQELAKKNDLVRKTTSLVDILKDINQSFHEGDPAYHVLPETRDLVAQYLLVYEMSGGEEVENFVSSDFARANLELRSQTTESSRFAALVEEIDAALVENPPKASSVSVTGIGALWVQLMTYITQSQIRGFLLAFMVIATLLCFIFRSFKVGAVAMVPNLAPVIITLGTMGWFDIPLDYARLLIASVALGISVDDTIHSVTRFAIEFGRSGRYQQALRDSFATVGRALVVTSAVLIVGFLTYRFSALDAVKTFGLLLSGTLAMALVADFTLMPALILTFRSFGPERQEERHQPATASSTT